jgi:preprotein translocase subunit SecD
VTLVGMMSLFQATLTLPGIAGLVLTVGMAIDANVLIFERIREELRAGKAVRPSIEAGHNKALWTVLDSNLTTLFTGVILYQYGTGPIKGFAVSLCVGILTSVFTSLVIPRLLFQVYPGNRPVKSLSI